MPAATIFQGSIYDRLGVYSPPYPVFARVVALPGCSGPARSSKKSCELPNADRQTPFRSIAHSLAALFQRRRRTWKRVLIRRPRTLPMSTRLLNGTEWLICRRARISPIPTQSNQRHLETRTTSGFFCKINRPAPGNPEVHPTRPRLILPNIPIFPC